jgi:hypothetical protein
MKRFSLLASAAIVGLVMFGATPSFAHGGGHGGGHGGHGGHGHGGHGHAHGGHHGGHAHHASHHGSFAHHHTGTHSYVHNGRAGHGWGGHGWGRGWGWGNRGWGYGGYWGGVGPNYVDGTTVVNPWYYPNYNQYYDVQEPVVAPGVSQYIERDYVTRPTFVPAVPPAGNAGIVDPANQPIDGESDGTTPQNLLSGPVTTASKY